MLELTPRQIVEELDKYIVGQKDAKRAIAVAIRNRWRRQHVEGEMRDEIGPKNMMMIGPTGVGKTEIARRLATLTGAPFVKVDATKYTEVGYYGRDVESMARELVENAIGIIRSEEREKNAEQAKKAAEKRIVDLLVEKFEREAKDFPQLEGNLNLEKNDRLEEKKESVKTEQNVFGPFTFDAASLDAAKQFAEKMRKATATVEFDPNHPERGFSNFLDALGKAVLADQKNEEKESEKTNPEAPKTEESAKKSDEQTKRERRVQIEKLLANGKFEDELVPVVEERRVAPLVMGGIGVEAMSDDIQNMLENIAPRRNMKRELPVSEARKIFQDQEADRLLDKDKLNARAIELAENLGIIFIDEIDKIVGSEGGRGADVSRQGVQRDLLPIVEGTTIQTKYGLFSTNHVLFIAAGAFHRAKPSDLTPELQGRFPIRVELAELKKEDFVRILTEPKSALTKQYAALMKTENVELVFKDDAIDLLAEYAAETNQTTQNIGARRLCTIMELLLEDLNFDAAEMTSGKVEVDAGYVRSKIDKVVNDEDLSKFVL